MALSSKASDVNTTYSAASSTVSDCGSSVTGGGSAGTNSDASSSNRILASPSPPQALVPLPADSREHVLLKHRLYAGLAGSHHRCRPSSCYLVASTCRVAYPAHRQAARARFEAFRLQAEDAAQGEPAAVRLAWYGARSQEEAARIAREGFGAWLVEGQAQAAVRLWPENRVGSSIDFSGVASRGLRHIVLCQVILRDGGGHAVLPGNGKGDGDHMNDETSCYVVSAADASTRVLPLYAVATKILSGAANSKGRPPATAAAAAVTRPTSPWIPLAALVTVLSGSLPENKVCLIKKLHNAYVERRISRQQMVHRLRQLSGDKILIAAIKAFQAKMMTVMIKSATQRDRGRM